MPSNVYIMFKNVDIEDITYQKSEVSEVMYMKLKDVYDMVKKEEQSLKKDDGVILDERFDNKSCIAFEEIEMVNNFVNDHIELYK